jgi:cold shock protein
MTIYSDSGLDHYQNCHYINVQGISRSFKSGIPGYLFLIENNKLYINNLDYLCSSYKLYTMNKGTVKFFNDAKGFGFIKDAESSTEYFVHSNGLKESIRENDEVTFDLEEGRKGLNAVNVKLA